MQNEQKFENKTILIEFGGVEYEVEVCVETNVESWNENHGPGLIEPMSDETYVGYELVESNDSPDSAEFLKLLEERIKEDYS